MFFLSNIKSRGKKDDSTQSPINKTNTLPSCTVDSQTMMTSTKASSSTTNSPTDQRITFKTKDESISTAYKTIIQEINDKHQEFCDRYLNEASNDCLILKEDVIANAHNTGFLNTKASWLTSDSLMSMGLKPTTNDKVSKAEYKDLTGFTVDGKVPMVIVTKSMLEEALGLLSKTHLSRQDNVRSRVKARLQKMINLTSVNDHLVQEFLHSSTFMQVDHPIPYEQIKKDLVFRRDNKMVITDIQNAYDKMIMDIDITPVVENVFSQADEFHQQNGGFTFNPDSDDISSDYCINGSIESYQEHRLMSNEDFSSYIRLICNVTKDDPKEIIPRILTKDSPFTYVDIDGTRHRGMLEPNDWIINKYGICITTFPGKHRVDPPSNVVKAEMRNIPNHVKTLKTKLKSLIDSARREGAKMYSSIEAQILTTQLEIIDAMNNEALNASSRHHDMLFHHAFIDARTCLKMLFDAETGEKKFKRCTYDVEKLMFNNSYPINKNQSFFFDTDGANRSFFASNMVIIAYELDAMKTRLKDAKAGTGYIKRICDRLFIEMTVFSNNASKRERRYHYRYLFSSNNEPLHFSERFIIKSDDIAQTFHNNGITTAIRTGFNQSSVLMIGLLRQLITKGRTSGPYMTAQSVNNSPMRKSQSKGERIKQELEKSGVMNSTDDLITSLLIRISTLYDNPNLFFFDKTIKPSAVQRVSDKIMISEKMFRLEKGFANSIVMNEDAVDLEAFRILISKIRMLKPKGILKDKINIAKKFKFDLMDIANSSSSTFVYAPAVKTAENEMMVTIGFTDDDLKKLGMNEEDKAKMLIQDGLRVKKGSLESWSTQELIMGKLIGSDWKDNDLVTLAMKVITDTNPLLTLFSKQQIAIRDINVMTISEKIDMALLDKLAQIIGPNIKGEMLTKPHEKKATVMNLVKRIMSYAETEVVVTSLNGPKTIKINDKKEIACALTGDASKWNQSLEPSFLCEAFAALIETVDQNGVQRSILAEAVRAIGYWWHTKAVYYESEMFAKFKEIMLQGAKTVHDYELMIRYLEMCPLFMGKLEQVFKNPSTIKNIPLNAILMPWPEGFGQGIMGSVSSIIGVLINLFRYEDGVQTSDDMMMFKSFDISKILESDAPDQYEQIVSMIRSEIHDWASYLRKFGIRLALEKTTWYSPCLGDTYTMFNSVAWFFREEDGKIKKASELGRYLKLLIGSPNDMRPLVSSTITSSLLADLLLSTDVPIDQLNNINKMLKPMTLLMRGWMNYNIDLSHTIMYNHIHGVSERDDLLIRSINPLLSDLITASEAQDYKTIINNLIVTEEGNMTFYQPVLNSMKQLLSMEKAMLTYSKLMKLASIVHAGMLIGNHKMGAMATIDTPSDLLRAIYPCINDKDKGIIYSLSSHVSKSNKYPDLVNILLHSLSIEWREMKTLMYGYDNNSFNKLKPSEMEALLSLCNVFAKKSLDIRSYKQAVIVEMSKSSSIADTLKSSFPVNLSTPLSLYGSNERTRKFIETKMKVCLNNGNYYSLYQLIIDTWGEPLFPWYLSGYKGAEMAMVKVEVPSSPYVVPNDMTLNSIKAVVKDPFVVDLMVAELGEKAVIEHYQRQNEVLKSAKGKYQWRLILLRDGALVGSLAIHMRAGVPTGLYPVPITPEQIKNSVGLVKMAKSYLNTNMQDTVEMLKTIEVKEIDEMIYYENRRSRIRMEFGRYTQHSEKFDKFKVFVIPEHFRIDMSELRLFPKSDQIPADPEMDWCSVVEDIVSASLNIKNNGVLVYKRDMLSLTDSVIDLSDDEVAYLAVKYAIKLTYCVLLTGVYDLTKSGYDDRPEHLIKQMVELGIDLHTIKNYVLMYLANPESMIKLQKHVVMLEEMIVNMYN